MRLWGSNRLRHRPFATVATYIARSSAHRWRGHDATAPACPAKVSSADQTRQPRSVASDWPDVGGTDPGRLIGVFFAAPAPEPDKFEAAVRVTTFLRLIAGTDDPPAADCAYEPTAMGSLHSLPVASVPPPCPPEHV